MHANPKPGARHPFAPRRLPDPPIKLIGLHAQNLRRSGDDLHYLLICEASSDSTLRESPDMNIALDGLNTLQ